MASSLRALLLLTVACATTVVLPAAVPLTAPLAAQVRGGAAAPYRAPAGWWVSGGATGTSSAFVNDAAANGRWRYAGDLVWFARGSIERAVGVTTTLGVSGFYGTGRARFSVLQPELTDPAPETPANRLGCFTTAGCAANVETFGASAVLRGGGGSAQEGVYQVLEFEAGVIGWRGVTLADDDTPFRTALRLDPMVSAGFGLGYALTDRLHLSFVQTLGYAWGRGDPLPDGVRASYEFRETRAMLRWGLGSRRF